MKEKGFWAATGAVAAAILGSSCCWLPLLLLALGAGTAAAGITGFVESFRPLIIVAALLLLGVAGYFTYFHKAAGEC